ncbi:integrase core domain-containing protein [Streptomyces sp. NPDC056231]|uniref:integrase core domain-containing protein n=1 Tax=Streptomyces sp. NPDC056231 TaxID=3345755 RepID=UPI003AB09685
MGEAGNSATITHPSPASSPRATQPRIPGRPRTGPQDKLCDRPGVVQSMGRVGSALDNAAAESFNSPIKGGYIHRNQFATRAEARLKIATWITDFYNPRRRHSGAAGLPPIEFERTISEARAEHYQKDQAA